MWICSLTKNNSLMNITENKRGNMLGRFCSLRYYQKHQKGKMAKIKD